MIIQYPNHFVQKTLVIPEEQDEVPAEGAEAAGGGAEAAEESGGEYGSEYNSEEDDYGSNADSGDYGDEEESIYPQIAPIPLI